MIRTVSKNLVFRTSLAATNVPFRFSAPVGEAALCEFPQVSDDVSH